MNDLLDWSRLFEAIRITSVLVICVFCFISVILLVRWSFEEDAPLRRSLLLIGFLLLSLVYIIYNILGAA